MARPPDWMTLTDCGVNPETMHYEVSVRINKRHLGFWKFVWGEAFEAAQTQKFSRWQRLLLGCGFARFAVGAILGLKQGVRAEKGLEVQLRAFERGG